MLKIGDHVYPLAGLDTNILSAIVLDRDDTRRGFFSLLAGHVPCFSAYSAFELRQSPNVYEAFLEFFDVVPCMLLKNEEQLFEDERATYPVHTDINPTTFGFSTLNRNRGTNLRSLLAGVFQRYGVLAREAEWPTLKVALLREWLALKPNFPPKGKNYTPADGSRFVDEASPQHVAFRAPEWVGAITQSGHDVDPNAFPSVRMTLWTIFFRLYWAHRRAGETQEGYDDLISTPAPYLDAIVTENFQADIYHKVRDQDPQLLNASIFTLRDLRQAASTP